MSEQKLTTEKATQLGNALIAQLARRHGAMQIEAGFAQGLMEWPSKPPPWALAAARIVNKSVTEAFRPEAGATKATPAQIGVLVGLAKTWGGLTANPTPSIQKLEEKAPVLTDMRARLAEISEKNVALGQLAEAHMTKTSLSPSANLDYAKGRLVGVSEVVDDTGEVKGDDSVRATVCFFVWLYWPEVNLLKSVTDLQKFIDEFCPDEVTRKNLEKICREIGLKFRERGRPKKSY